MIISKYEFTPKGHLSFFDENRNNITKEVVLTSKSGKKLFNSDRNFIKVPTSLWEEQEFSVFDRLGNKISIRQFLDDHVVSDVQDDRIQTMSASNNVLKTNIFKLRSAITKIETNIPFSLNLKANSLGIKLPFEYKYPLVFRAEYLDSEIEQKLIPFTILSNNEFSLDLTGIEIDKITSLELIDVHINEARAYPILEKIVSDDSSETAQVKINLLRDKVIFSESDDILAKLGNYYFSLNNEVPNSYFEILQDNEPAELELFALRNNELNKVYYHVVDEIINTQIFGVFKDSLVLQSKKAFNKDEYKSIEHIETINVDIVQNSTKDFILKLPYEIETVQAFITTSARNPTFQELKVQQLASENSINIFVGSQFDEFGEVINKKLFHILLYVQLKGEIHPTLYKVSLNTNVDNKNFMYNAFSLDGSLGKYRQYVQLLNEPDSGLVFLKGAKHNLAEASLDTHVTVTNIVRENVGFRVELEASGRDIKMFNIKSVRLVHRNVIKPTQHDFPVDKINESNDALIISVLIDLEHEYIPYYWDLFLVGESSEYNDEIIWDVTSVNQKAEKKVDKDVFSKELKVGAEDIIYPYITAGDSMSFTYRKQEDFENKWNFFKEKMAFIIYKTFKYYFDWKNIWIVFEKNSFGAHDNGYHFFKYMYENEKQPNTYYVIRKDSPEYKNMKKMSDRVLKYMSLKYFVYMFASQVFISSDTKFHSYNLQRRDSKLAKSMLTKKNVFLQHGVNGIKKVPVFHKKRGLLDLIIAPSNFEMREINVKQWGYSSEEVVATGYSRWDSYKDKTHTIPYKQVFMMPTWRKWMEGMSKEDFKTTPFYHEYQTFLSSPKLKEVMLANNVRIAFFLHPYFKEYVDLFEIDDSFVDQYGYLGVDMGEEIMKSSLMISDYSSVVWDMYYLKKPVMFYQFDQDDYLKSEGAYLDYDKDLFGDVVFNADSAIKILSDYAQNGFQEKTEFKVMRDKYLDFNDHNNSERIYKAIMAKKDLLSIHNEWTVSRKIRRKLWKLKKSLLGRK